MTALALPLPALFSAASTLAGLSWLALIVLPRWPWLLKAIQVAVIGALCVLYALLISLYFFRADGGFGTLAAVQALFTSAPVALAGWLHYLAFDLFVGVWIAGRCDALGVPRWLQAPVLVATFLFGPIGLLLYGALRASWRAK